MQKSALSAAIAIALLPGTADAVSYEISGHVNRALRYVDDGQGSQIQNVDSAHSRSRIRFVGSERFGNLQAGIYLELGFASNRSSTLGTKSTGVDGDSPSGSDSFGSDDDIRHSTLWFEGSWGRLTLGHTSDTYDDMTGEDLSGTGLVMSSASGGNALGSVAFRTTNGGLAGTTVGSAFNTLDGGRIDILRYDTPALGPFRGAVYTANDEEWGASAFLVSRPASGELRARIGYQDSGNRSGRTQFGGSVAYLFDQGTSVALGYSNRDFTAPGRSEAELFYAKLGHRWSHNALAVEYGSYDDHVAGGSDGTLFGIGFVHSIPKVGVELYASYENYDLDLPGQSVEDIDLGMIGARVAFK